jgi:hypothetical protein
MFEARHRPGPGGLLAAGSLLALAAAGPARAQSSADWYEVSSRRQTDGVEHLKAEVEYGMGRLELRPAGDGLLYDMKLRYDGRRFDPLREWSKQDATGHLVLRLLGDDAKIDLDDLDDADGSDGGSLAIGVSRDVPTDLSLTVMAAEVDMRLGGAALKRFIYRTAASETVIDFDRPNAVRMDRLELSAGAADFRAKGLGNARFDALEFNGAVGDVRLDFSGDWEESATGEIRMGLGALTLVFPRDIGVRIEKRGFLASFDATGFDRVEGGFQTPNWADAPVRLTLSVQAGFGDIDVDFVD